MYNRLLKALVPLAILTHSDGFQVPSTSTAHVIASSSTSVKSSVLEELSAVGERTSAGSSTVDLPPLLQDMVNERRNFEINLGRAMDVLRKDYPYMLYKTPDFSIYHDQINVVDPSGVQLSGLSNYKNSFSFLQTIVRFFYNTNESEVQSRMIYDFARQSIRISWNAVLVPKVLGNRRNAMYIDGISVYKMDSESGKIVEHTVEKMLINNIPVQPPYNVLSALRDELLRPVDHRIPVGVGAGVGAMAELLEESAI
mmetsp:Transcript_12952/g.16380  ORF Transcript_12952/g.16380 Transcript_12952/m.16380 type:complete len:255 (+) Transcript_12952:141-905(+)|eukprot:CAMPEP_0203656892 /NCGR_PEP_ID=MMETSP0088-20131115/42934_1 /ASSEMBLY_ACC=CAM_ASM_001087 /TAXON_ID=426623 /ORGANISM="Chaetoceros affinis, Strain CCMP159" /LENGTH=254 /DNA_ID=CAMNT_0050518005 /DNA_START=116 /DNA_END=880 /DNA_ORIENTATION=+